jgi:uncharacterized phage protein (TIGR01671 family)
MEIVELKFRAFDKEEGKIIYSFDGGGQIHQLEMFFLSLSIKENIFDKSFVVMRYTGIKDACGKDIYEGDIIQNILLAPSEKPKEVKYFAGNARFIMKGEKYFSEFNATYGDEESIVCENLKVIGNIYETPELLQLF